MWVLASTIRSSDVFAPVLTIARTPSSGKVAREPMLWYFNEIFDGLNRVSAAAG